jgi:DNA-binding MarR family transcriptional regulator
MARNSKRSDLKAIELAMTEIRRRQHRRTLSEAADLRAWGRDDLGLLPALEAIEELGDQATVGAIAALTGLDQSRSSRMVSAALKTGYVVRVASQSDGRSTLLRLTKSGERFTRLAHDYRQGRIDDALAGWSHDDRHQLAALMARFSQAIKQTATEISDTTLVG